MQTFSGGQLRFKYDFSQKKMIPYTEDLVVTELTNSNNKDQIMSWINSNKRLVSINTEASAKGSIAIDIEDEDLEYVTSILDRCGFRYE